MSTLIIIPARAGSKGLPKKNVRLLGDKPLLAYSIDFAKAIASSEDHVCVSSNDDDVIFIAKKLGITPDFKRSEELSGDKASMYDVIADALKFYEERDRQFDKILLLQPTSPFRAKGDYHKLCEAFLAGCDMAVTVSHAKENPYFTLFEEKSNGLIEKSKPASFVRRQDCPPVYALNGSMYLISVQSFKNSDTLAFNEIRKAIIPKKRSVDIDDIDDFKVAQYLLNTDLYEDN